jgi:hypothetical protein
VEFPSGRSDPYGGVIAHAAVYGVGHSPQSQHEQHSQHSQISQASQQPQSQSQLLKQPSRFLRDQGPSNSSAQHTLQVQHTPIAAAHPAQKPRLPGPGGWKEGPPPKGLPPPA